MDRPAQDVDNPSMRHTALLIPCVLLACAEPAWIETTVSDLVPTTITVSFHGVDLGAVACYVDVDADHRTRFEEVPSDDGTCDVVVWGLIPGTEYLLDAGQVRGGRDEPVDQATVTTGPSPTDLPELLVDSPGEPLEGLVLTTLLAAPSAAVMVDGRGRYRWWHVLEDDDLTTNRARMSHDGASVLLRLDERDGPSQGLRRVAFDGTELDAVDVCPEAHHDFAELPDGTVAVLCHDTRKIDGESIVGDRLVEVAPDHTTTDVWFVWDHWDYDPIQGQDPHWGYAHANALDHQAETDTYTLSTRKLDTIFHIHRPDGAVSWRFGGDQSDFVPADALTSLPTSQHQHQLLGDRLLVFDNGPPTELASRAVEYTLDTESWTTTEAWWYWPDPPLYSYAYGDVERLPDGSTLVTFSVSGQMDLVDEVGALRWRMNAQFGGALGYATRIVGEGP